MPVGNTSAVAKLGSPMVWSSTRLGGERRFFSTWSALGNPVFRKLWIAAVISGTCVAAHDTALFALFISVIPALMPVVGLKALHLNPSQLGLLFTSMGARLPTNRKRNSEPPFFTNTSINTETYSMEAIGLLVTLEARAGKEADAEAFLKSAQPLALNEKGTLKWYAIKLGPGKFGIFDTFANEAGRNAHLTGEIAKAWGRGPANYLRFLRRWKKWRSLQVH